MEHTQGKLPVWLTPTQVIVMPITDKQKSYALKIANKLRTESIRTQLDDRNETLQAKIRDASMQKTPYLLIIGDKEEKTDQISIRTREGETLAEKELANFTSKLKKEIENRT